MMDYLIIALVSYLFGSIPFGFILTKIFLKKDIRNIGSGNILVQPTHLELVTKF